MIHSFDQQYTHSCVWRKENSEENEDVTRMQRKENDDKTATACWFWCNLITKPSHFKPSQVKWVQPVVLHLLKTPSIYVIERGGKREWGHPIAFFNFMMQQQTPVQSVTKWWYKAFWPKREFKQKADKNKKQKEGQIAGINTKTKTG